MKENKTTKVTEVKNDVVEEKKVIPATEKATPTPKVKDKTTRKPRQKKKEETVTSRPSKVKGNLTHLQDADRVIKIAKRDPVKKFDIVTTEIKAKDYEVGVAYDANGNKLAGSYIHYVDETYNGVILKKKMNRDSVRRKETFIRMFPIAEFLRVGREMFCKYQGEDENGDSMWNIHPNALTPSHIFVLMKNIDRKFIESRFEDELINSRGYYLRSQPKTKKIESLLEKFKELKMVNCFIKADNILHIPNFDATLTLDDI